MADPMRIRAQAAGDKTTVRVLMSHEMETGQRKDSAGKCIGVDTSQGPIDAGVVMRHEHPVAGQSEIELDGVAARGRTVLERGESVRWVQTLSAPMGDDERSGFPRRTPRVLSQHAHLHRPELGQKPPDHSDTQADSRLSNNHSTTRNLCLVSRCFHGGP